MSIFWQKNVQELHLTQPFFFLAFALLVLSLLLLLNSKKRKKLPPSPPKLPLIGNLHQLVGSLPRCSFRNFSEKYGPLLLLHFGQAPALIVSSPELAKEIMKTHDIIFANRYKPIIADALFYGGKEIGFSPCGENWREMKKLCVTELLSHKRVQSFHFIRERQVKNLISRIRDSCLQKVPVNVSELLISISCNMICASVLGGSNGEEGGTRFMKVTENVAELFLAFSFRDYFPFLGWLDKYTGLVGRLKGTSKELDAFLDQAITQHEYCRKSKNGEYEAKDFVEVLLHVKEDKLVDFDLTQDNMRGILLDMLIGGNDTTSAAMEWVMTELARNPTAMRKAQEEVRKVVGKKLEMDPTDIMHMEYLKCVIKETLRLHPPAPLLLPRETLKWEKLDGYDIPPQTRIFINAWAIQRDPKLWVMAGDFFPDRFHDNPVDFSGQYFQFIPFGSGRRGCPGTSLAIATVEYVIANLMYWFDWNLPVGVNGEDMDMDEALGVVLRKKTPLHLVATSYNP